MRILLRYTFLVGIEFFITYISSIPLIQIENEKQRALCLIICNQLLSLLVNFVIWLCKLCP